MQSREVALDPPLEYAWSSHRKVVTAPHHEQQVRARVAWLASRTFAQVRPDPRAGSASHLLFKTELISDRGWRTAACPPNRGNSMVTDISHEGLRVLLREETVRFQAVRTWKRSNDPEFEAKRDRIVALYELAAAGIGVVICLDEFGR